MTLSHDALAEDLAAHLNRDGKNYTWLNCEIPGCDGGRPDVLSFARWRYNDPKFVAYEIKVSIADLRRDLDAGKWSKYLGACSAVIFAMPHGLVAVKDLPPGFGVMFRSERGWRSHRRPPENGPQASAPAMAKLLSTPRWRPQGGRMLSDTYYGQRSLDRSEKAAIHAFGQRYGKVAAEFIAAKTKGEDPVSQAVKSLESINRQKDEHAARIRAELAEICEFLEIDPTSDIYKIRRSVKELATRLTLEGEQAALYRQLAYIRDAVGDALLLRDKAKD